MKKESFNSNEIWRKKWRDLGFYYELNEENKNWVFVGSKEGLRNLCHLLRNYIAKPINQEISEHEHFGPYLYLKVVTWYEPKIVSDGIYGRLDDIDKLTNIIEKGINSSDKTSFTINKEYSDKNEYGLCFQIKENTFDPSSMDYNM